jgi:hypothetical protein
MSTFGRDSKKNKAYGISDSITFEKRQAFGTSDSITFKKDKPSEPPTALLSKKISLRNIRQRYFRKRQAFGTSDSNKYIIKQKSMATIKNFDVTRLHQEEDFGFHTLMLKETGQCTDAKVVPLHTVYANAFAKFDEALKPGGKDPATTGLTNLDTQRDQAYSGMTAATRAQLNHYDPDIASIAKTVSDIIKKYGNPTALGYVEENGVIQNLIQELKVYDNPPSGDRPEIESSEIVHNRLTAIGIKGWVDHLESLNNEFITAFSNRNAAQAAIQTGASKATREVTDKAYRDIVRRINALIEVNGEEDYAEMVGNMNQLIDYQSTTLAARQTRNDKKNKNNDRPEIE